MTHRGTGMRITEDHGAISLRKIHEDSSRNTMEHVNPFGDTGGDPATTGYPDSLWALVSNSALSKCTNCGVQECASIT